MVEEKKIEEKEQYKGLHTMLQTEVYDELTELAKENKSFTGGWDYSTTIKELLWVRRVFFNVNMRLDELELQLKSMDSKVKEQELKPKKVDEKEDNPLGLLGKIDKEEKKENGKDTR